MVTIVDEKRKVHSKASEEYLHVKFIYENSTWEGWVPVEYRRTGVSIKTESETIQRLNDVYNQLNPNNYQSWVEEQNEFWETKSNATVTKRFYDVLCDGKWHCVECSLPKNPNWARRIQDLKEFGYTLSTNTKQFCTNCAANKTHIMLLPIKRGVSEGNGYETWSPALRKRIIKVLNSFDVYESVKNPHVLPDHKFSEIRWDNDTKAENPDTMTDEEIKAKFQLLSNQRNQQKREVCRNCYQTGKRGVVFGIPFFYEGGSEWDDSIPRKGKNAEKGCVGCPWYDIQEWRKKLLEKLNKN